MISRYETIELDDAVAGMILCLDVLDHQGGVLLPKGAPLTDALLTSLRRRGIDTVQVLNQGVTEQQLAQERERIQARLAHLFRKCADQPIAAVVLRQLTDYRLQELQ
jgi:hypothetical protein